MNDAEIIKALECCANTTVKESTTVCLDCCFCPYEDCTTMLSDEAYQLIKRQQAEIELFADIGKMYSEIRAEAVKEFAKELIINLDGDIEAYANAGHGLNVYEWLVSYMNSKGAIENEHREQ